MATAEQYAQWIVSNKDKQGTPEFETVSRAYRAARQRASQPQQEVSADPTEGMTAGERVAAGAGRAVVAAGRGIRQTPLPSDLVSALQTGRAPRLESLAKEEQQARELEAPLMRTGAGRVGNVLGTAGVLAPTALIPGANTLAGSAIIGGATAPLITTGSPQEKIEAAKAGLAGGPVGIAAGRALGAGLRASGRRAAAQSGERSVTDDLVRQARADGFVIPPSEMASSAAGRAAAAAAESVSGKAATRQAASVANRRAANGLVRRDFGLTGNGQINEAQLGALRRPHLEVYGRAAEVSPRAREALQAWRQANYEAKRQARFYGRTFDPAAEDAANAARSEAAQHLADVEQEAIGAGQPELARQLQAARRELGRIGSLEDALTEHGDVSMLALARQLERGVPLSGGMERAARFGSAFPRYAQESAATGMTGSSKLAAATAAGTAAVTGEPLSLAIFGIPYATRQAILSRPAQALAAPSANPGQLRANIGNALMTPRIRNALALSGLTYAVEQ